ncbi:polysaccharide biosynthesis protein [Bacillus sp. DTU_2020_1000418_1_SI_GHA_SEK_038]|uniref:putative polysaccharide biosynthesis protein n=1 Tax=Bacillus sp. DTU_2020_1000418_1_SI_GHA_SEK_038 TaxID=3077585 RepID=UPI0028ED8CAB|nr:polysaccharide biosynthesis protein [Bacillus sp. DTU_2020_1000418_1_SI_GHA_SEK_038]WNS75553.1 polysaccharide biosynthesis protein [Bacillus sp. DTU_2020_1000418_1_SI_GHA_SEK_038]
MRPEKKAKELFKGAFILTFAALIVKILSAVYRVPFQNMVGDVGFYIYQQVYPFYGVALVLSTYGFPVVISKLYTELSSRKDKNGVQHLFITSALILFIIGFFCFAFLFWGADWLAAQMKDPKLAILLKVISVTFLIFPVVSLLRGFYQGKGNMVPTAVSQVVEQFIRVLTIFLAAFLLTSKGYSLYVVGGGAAFGSVTGGITAVIVLITFYWAGRRKSRLSLAKFNIQKIIHIARALLVQGFAVCVSSMLLVFLQMADSLNLYSMLISSGIDAHEAKELKGIYDRGQPLIQVGMVVATSMSLSLVPIIASEKLNSNFAFMHDKIRLALKIALFVGVAATVGLWNIIRPTNIMLFENSEGSDVLGVLSIIILLSSIIITVTAILQGLGIILFPAFVILGSLAVKYVLNAILVPPFGTMGAAGASCLTLSLIMVILLVKLRSQLRTPILNKRFILIVGIAAFSMFIVLRVYLYITGYAAGFNEERLFACFQALSAVAVGGFSYLWIVLKGNTFKEKELSMLPFGSKLLFFLPKRNRR